MTARFRSTAFALGTLVLLIFASGCNELKKGVSAFHQGDYASAVRNLEKIAAKQAGKIPKFRVSLDRDTTVEQALPHLTRDLFDGWQAYAGSLLGLGRLMESCVAMEFAFRPVLVTTGKGKTRSFDPRLGDHWQAQVMTLRSWYLTTACQQALEETPIYP